MFRVQFKLRSLFLLTVLAAFIAVPVYEKGVELVQRFAAGPEPSANLMTTVQLPKFAVTSVSTVVSVPDGGTILISGPKRLIDEQQIK